MKELNEKREQGLKAVKKKTKQSSVPLTNIMGSNRLERTVKTKQTTAHHFEKSVTSSRTQVGLENEGKSSMRVRKLNPMAQYFKQSRANLENGENVNTPSPIGRESAANS